MEIKCRLDRLIFRNDETDWGVFECVNLETKESFVMRGICHARIGQTITAYGEWGVDRKGRQQFDAQTVKVEIPATVQGLEKFLSSGAIPGVRKRLARRMVDVFGETLMEVLNERPHELIKVPGLSRAKVERIAANWKEYKATNEIVAFLGMHGINPAMAKMIYERFGEKSISEINKNPYILISMKGIGFKRADAVAMALGFDKNDPERIRQGIIFVLDSNTRQGHCGMPLQDLVSKTAALLEVNETDVDAIVKEMIAEDEPAIDVHDLVVYPEHLARAEETVAEVVASKCATTKPLVLKPDDLIEEVEKEKGFRLTEQQKDAVRMALSKSFSILTGGPGCGKTSTLNILLSLYDRIGLSVALAAPTGKAAQRASEATGRQAQTLHRLLGLGKQEEPKKVEEDVLVIDEASMIDIPLMEKVCEALDYRTRVLIVGDADQLPSVGPGNVLRDMINSGMVPTVELNQVFRQAEGSLIIENAHRINAGKPLQKGERPEDDFWVISEENYKPLAAEDAVQKTAAEMVVRMVTERIPLRRGMNPDEIWVLSPVNKGECGVDNLNALLQKALNPNPDTKVEIWNRSFGVGDRVIQTVNDYDLGIFNGDVGRIVSIDEEEDLMMIRFEGRDDETVVPVEKGRNLKLAYAMTIHKSQGSQARAVVIPLLSQHYMLLQRNVLYTGVTRATELVVIVGQEKAIRTAIRRNDGVDRLTRLESLLIEQML